MAGKALGSLAIQSRKGGVFKAIQWFTPRKINVEPENTQLKEDPNHHFQVLS